MEIKAIKFSDIKDEVQKTLEKKLKDSPIPNEPDGFTLIQGFMTPSLLGEISPNFTIGGPNIPMVGIVGNTSGRVYTFALKMILPDIQI